MEDGRREPGSHEPVVAVENQRDDPPKSESEETSGTAADYLRIFTFADKYDWLLNAVAAITGIGGGTIMPLMTVVFGQFTNIFNDFAAGKKSAGDFSSEVHKYLLYYVYLFVAKFALTYVATLAISISGIRTTRNIRQTFLSHLLRTHIWQFDLPRTGSPAVQVTTNATRINKGIAEVLISITQAVVTLVASFIVALAVQWKLALIAMTSLPVIFVVTGYCMSVEISQEVGIMTMYSRAASVADEALSSVRTMHAFGAQNKMLQRYDAHLAEAHKLGNKKSINFGILYSTEYFCVYSAIALSFWQGYRMYASGEVEGAGTVMTVVFAILIAASSISSIAPHLTTLTNAAAAAAELFSIIDIPSALDPLDGTGEKPNRCIGDIEFRNVDFYYPSRPSVQVLQHMTLTIPAGKSTALVGPSGCGKSTVIGLLERWYQTSSGSITLDGVELNKYNTKWLRTNIRLVQQEPVLFRGTVFENVATGFVDSQMSLPMEEKKKLVEEACITSNAHGFIQGLPKGYETEVGEWAGMLSGGQKQRIAIARSIVSDPKILLLDEATSALDPHAEKVVQEALDRVCKGRTTVMIAHRLSTVKDADNIVVMTSGGVVEQGTHEELLARKGRYARLVEAQGLGVSDPEKSTAENSDTDVEGDDAGDRGHGLEKPTTVVSAYEQTLSAVLESDKKRPEYSVFRSVIMLFAEQKSLYPLLLVAVAATVIAAATFPGQALLFSRVFGVFTTRSAQSDANFWSLMFFIVALGNLICYFILGFVSNLISQAFSHFYRRELFDRIIRMDISFFDLPGHTSGALSSKLSSVPTLLQELISFNVFTILGIIVNVTASSILAIAYGWKLGLVVVFGGLPPLVGSGYLRMRIERGLDDQTASRFAESASIASEAVSAIRTVSSLTLEQPILNRYNELLSHVVLRSIKVLGVMAIAFALSQSLDYLVMALGFWYGSRLLVSGEYTSEQFYVVFLGVLLAGQAAAQFFLYSTSLSKCAGAANYVFWLRTVEAKIRENDENQGKGPDLDGNIRLEEVEFRYQGSGNSRVLKGISMDVAKGQFIALVGASGCGKSTIVSLLERYYDPTSGQVRIGADDIRTLSPRLYRQHISLVQQEPVLYQGSVRDNITIGLPDGQASPSDAELEAICRQANAWDFVSSLPQGLNTPCGFRGLSFSGGQRQRIAIARAVMRNPRILLLDEATSALDTENERVVQAALNDAARNGQRTMVAVAHRLSTIRNADIIYVLSGGRVAESGSHEELYHQKGMYYQMCMAQSLDRAV